MDPAPTPAPIGGPAAPAPRPSICALFTRIRPTQFQALDRAFAGDPLLASFSVAVARYVVVNLLLEHDADRISSLCQDASDYPGAMTSMGDRLEATGLIPRGRSMAAGAARELPAGADPGALRARIKGASRANNGYDRVLGEAAVAPGAAELVAVGRPSIANPDPAERLRRAARFNIGDPTTNFGGSTRGHADYPILDDAYDS